MTHEEMVDELVAFIYCLLDGKEAEIKMDDLEKAKHNTISTKKNFESGTITLKPFNQ